MQLRWHLQRFPRGLLPGSRLRVGSDHGSHGLSLLAPRAGWAGLGPHCLLCCLREPTLASVYWAPGCCAGPPHGVGWPRSAPCALPLCSSSAVLVGTEHSSYTCFSPQGEHLLGSICSALSPGGQGCLPSARDWIPVFLTPDLVVFLAVQ